MTEQEMNAFIQQLDAIGAEYMAAVARKLLAEMVADRLERERTAA